MQGLIVYTKKDYDKNSQFVDWIIDEFNCRHVKLDLLFLEKFYANRKIDKHYEFLINRTRDVNLSLLFEINGIRAFNNSQITWLGNNKYAAYHFAKNNGFEIPQILINPQIKNSVICKSIDGHGGEGIYKLNNNEFNENYLYQQFIEKLNGDIRFYVINNKIYKAVRRYSDSSYIFNYSKGGKCCEYEYSTAEYDYVNSMISLLKIDYAGFDFFLTKDSKLIFNEIEDVVGSRMLSKIGDNQTVPLFVKHIIDSVG